MAVDLTPSSGLRRAAAAERSRIERTRGRLEGRREHLLEQVAELDAELRKLAHRERLLDELAGADPRRPNEGEQSTGAASDRRVLRGREFA